MQIKITVKKRNLMNKSARKLYFQQVRLEKEENVRFILYYLFFHFIRLIQFNTDFKIQLPDNHKENIT